MCNALLQKFVYFNTGIYIWKWKIKSLSLSINLPLTPKFQSVSLYSHLYSRYRPFWVKFGIWGTRIPNFTPFCCMVIRFRVTGHFACFETCAQNDLKMTMNTKRSKVPHIYMIYMLQLPPSQSFSVIHSIASHFRVTGYFEISAPNDPKMFFNTKGEMYPIYMLHPPTPTPSPKFHSILLYWQPFLSYTPVWDKCTAEFQFQHVSLYV